MQSTNIAQAALGADWEKVRQLVERGDDVNVVGGWYHGTGLHWAADWGNKAICELLLKSGANISATDKNGDQPLHRAVDWNKAAVCELLVAHGADVTAVNKEGQTPLMKAVDNCSAVPCRPLITNDSVNVEDCDGNHALHIASRRSNIVAVQLLVDCGADTNAVNKHGQTPLHTAAGGEKDCPELCEILLKHDAEINAVDEDGNQPLHVACTKSCTKTVKVMVSHGADMDTANKHGQTPLHTAAGGWKDCPELCEILLKHGAEINAVDNDGNQPLHVACTESQTKTVKVMVSHGADVNAMNKHGQTPLHTAAGGWKDCPELCEILLKHDTRINAVDEDGNQPLHLACQKAHTEIVKWMLSHGADTNAANKHGQMPLHTAAGGRKDCPELCEILLKHSAKTNAVDEDGNQPLHLAGKGAEVDAVDGNGDTSLQIALRKGNVKTTEVLLANGADRKVLNGCGETVLHLLCKGCVDGNELCENLISCGVNPHVADRDSTLPLHIAVKNKLPKASWSLFKQLGGSSIHDLLKIQDKDIVYLLCLAVCSSDAECCQKLLDLGANPNELSNVNQLPDLNVPDAASVFPLHIAVAKNNSELCCLLLDHGATVNVRMHTHSNTCRLHLAQPLHVAVQLGFIAVCHLLIERGALINAETGKGKSPLYLAIVGNRDDIAQLLLSFGATVNNVKIGGISALRRSRKQGTRSLAALLHDSNVFPDEIVSQGEAALQIYLSSCSEGTAVTVFLRVDVVGRDGAGKTSLTKSLTLQEFDPNELSTRGVVFDPKCQIIVKEACDWTTPLTSEHYRDMYDKNVTAIVADKLDTPDVKDQYFRSKEAKRLKRSKRGQKRSHVPERPTSTKKKAIKPSVNDSPLVGRIDSSPVDVSTEENPILFPVNTDNAQQHNNELDTAVTVCDNRLHENELEVTMSDFHSDRSSPLVSAVNLDTPQTSSLVFPLSSSRSLYSITATPTPQSSLAAHQLTVSKFRTSSLDEEEQTAGTEESSVILPKGSKHDNTTEATTTVTEAAAVQQYDKQSNQRTKRKRKTQVALVQESKHGKATEEATTNSERSALSQQHNQHPKQSEENKEKRNRMTQSVPQPSGVSDTTTFSPSRETETERTVRLPENVQKGVSKFLRDKESLEKAQKEMMVTVLDYAGQHVFYATHHLCLSKAGFYYVVFDASRPLDGKTPSVFRVRKGEIVHIPLFDDETNFERLLEWMSAIHIMEPDHSHRIMLFDDIEIASPAMFLVGTHADKLREQPGLLERQDELMRNKLEGTVLAKHIIWASKDRMCFYVDNTLTDPQSGTVDPQVHLLRQMTEEVARKVAQHHSLPLPWLKFEQEVRDVKISDETKKTVSVEDLLHIAKRAAGIKTREELEVLLHYLSNRAVLLYHPKALKGIEEGVVLDVEWLISQLEKVVTIHTDVPPTFKNDVTRTVQRGIMTASLIRYLLSESGSAQRLIISLMNHFDLLCQYAGFEADELHKADDNRDFLCLDGPEEDPCFDDISVTENCDYFIPCLLERASPLESQQLDATLKTMPLLLSSAPLRIPRPLFYRVLTHLCKRFRQLPVLYSNVGYFHISPDHRLEFSLNRYSFQFAILSETEMPPRSTVCSHTRDYILNAVDKLKLEGMAGLHLRIGFHLTATCLPESVVPEDDVVSLDGFPDQRRQLYNSRNRQVDVPCELLMWYPQLGQKGKFRVIYPDRPLQSGSEIERLSYATPVQDLIGDSPSQCVVEISRLLDQPDKMEDDWRRLWSELLNRPFNEEVVSQTEEGPTHFLLKLWCRMKPPSQVTVGHMIQALNSIYRNDVARIVEKYCKKLPMHLVRDDTAGTCDVSMSVCRSQDVSLSENTACSSGVTSIVTTGADSELTKAQIDAMPPMRLLGDDTAALHGGNGVCGSQDVSRKASLSEGVAACSSVTSSTLISHLLAGCQPHECLLEVAAMMDKEDDMGDDWRKLWTDLVNRPLNEAVAQHRPEGPTIYTLKLWVRSGKRSQATVGRLIKALSDAYRNDAAEVLEEYAQVCSDDTSTKDSCESHLMDSNPSFHSGGSDSKQHQMLPLQQLSEDTTGTRDGDLTVHGSEDVSKEASSSQAAGPSDVAQITTNDTVTLAQLNAVAKVARAKWFEVGLALGLEMEELDDYEEKEPRSLYRRLLRLLVDWKKKQEYPAVGDLVSACQEAGIGGAVKGALEVV